MLPKKMIPLTRRVGSQMFRRLQTALVLVVLLSLGLASTAFAGDIHHEFKFDSRKLNVANLVGEIQVEGGSGDQFIVEIDVRGDDAEDGLLNFVVEKGSKSSLAVQYPTEKYTKYVYPPLGRMSNTSISWGNARETNGSWLKKVFSGAFGDRIKVSGRGSGLEVWADITIRVPEGASLTMKNGVGKVFATNVEGNLVLDTSSGAVKAESIRGDLLVDTGSGSVNVSDVRGNLLVDTGSGGVRVNGVKGDLNIDTGSGSVKARRIESDEAKIDTGSGSVVLELDRMGTGDFVVDTGSGSVELILPSDASARIVADTGSGGIRNRIDDARIRHKDRDRLEMTVGDGEAKVLLDTGSGSVTISRQ
jgi:lia operon protein LiaG